MRGQIRRFLLIYHRLLRPHPSERGRDLWFQEEARAERLSNFIRIVYVLAWLMAAALHAPGNRFWANPLRRLPIGEIELEFFPQVHLKLITE